MIINNKKIYLHTLGCRLNICESEKIISQLKKQKAKIVDKLEDAEIVIINTCSVTSKADSKSLYFINHAIKSKNCNMICVIGCYSQENYSLLNNEKIKIILGTKEKSKLVDYLLKYNGTKQVIVHDLKKYNEVEDIILESPAAKTRVFLKIQDGCDQMCSYCTIPYLRGHQCSIPPNTIIKTIEDYIKQGYYEIVLTGVNISGYSYKQTDFYKLLLLIDKIKGEFRIRISSVEPFLISKKIIDLICNNSHFCQCLHLCLQSGCDKILKDMNRHYTIKFFIDLVNYIHNLNPLFSITTDLIVGFPTETNEDFLETIKTLNTIKFANIHIFPYSSRPHTVASKLKNIVSDIEKRRRVNIVNDLNNKFVDEYLKQFINKEVNVYFEKNKNKYIANGHSQYYFQVFLKETKNIHKQIETVLLGSIKNHELYGKKIINKNPK